MYNEFLRSVGSGRLPNAASEEDRGKEDKRGGGVNKNFYCGDDERFQEVVCKVGEGCRSEVFKVFDNRRGEVI
ncbi:hypothetical protein M9Y10_005320 [Tritrichomonas musculus]|uniref:Uncharacterized protein n=1 Tax=Tritrichomonas musculus TaxID=1915356 RepID=A0ABR2JKU2_9EUKA